MPVADTLKVAVFPEMIVWLAGCVAMAGATVVFVTVSTAGLLVAFPTVLLTSAVNCELLSAAVSEGVVYVEEFAPLIVLPFFFHRYVMGAVPVAATLNVAVCPAAIFTLAGCDEIAGAIGAVVVAPLPVPIKLTENSSPFARVNFREPE